MKISDFLQHGEQNAITAAELQILTQIRCRRDLVRAIQQERLAGIPICASNDSNRPGYYLPESPKDVERYAETLRKRAKELRRVRAAVLASVKVIDV